MSASSPDEADRARIVWLLRSLHDVQLYDEALFALMLEHGGPLTLDQRCKIEACRLLELAMGRRLSDHLVLNKGDGIGPPGRGRLSAAGYTAVHQTAWKSRMAALEASVDEVIPSFRELKALYADREPDLCNTLLAHVLVLREFARLEAQGEGERSLTGVLSLLGAEAREALSQFAG